jgi:hypothetical protein
MADNGFSDKQIDLEEKIATNHELDRAGKDKQVTHDEKISTHHEPDLADAAARRASVALNIVENPLRVSFPKSPHSFALHTTTTMGTTTLTRTARHQGAECRGCARLL